MLQLFSINLVQFETVWLLEMRDVHLFWDEWRCRELVINRCLAFDKCRSAELAPGRLHIGFHPDAIGFGNDAEEVGVDSGEQRIGARSFRGKVSGCGSRWRGAHRQHEARRWHAKGRVGHGENAYDGWGWQQWRAECKVGRGDDVEDGCESPSLWKHLGP
jgi:hypothetical protein